MCLIYMIVMFDVLSVVIRLISCLSLVLVRLLLILFSKIICGCVVNVCVIFSCL